jgi:hypothetical protein
MRNGLGIFPSWLKTWLFLWESPNTPGEETDSLRSAAAVAHGKIRRLQGYTAALLVHDSRILQVTIFGTLQNNLSALDFSLLLPDVMTIADEVDSQLTQTMDSFMNATIEPAAA